MSFENRKKGICKSEISLHEFFRFLRSVNAGSVNDKVRSCTVLIQFFRSGVYIIFVNLPDVKIWSGSILPISDCL